MWAALGRIAAFLLFLLAFFAAAAIPVERLSGLNWPSWSNAVAAILALVMMSYIERRPLRSFGFVIGRSVIPDLTTGLAAGAVTMGAVALVQGIFGWYRPDPPHYSPDVGQAIFTNAGVFLAIGIAEEVIYRGYILQTLERYCGTDRALGATILVFGLEHLFIEAPAATIGLKVIGALSIAAEAGVLFGAAYLYKRSLWTAIGVHWAWNFVEGPILGLPVTGTDFGPSLITAHTSGPLWAPGGTLGPEASIPCLVLGTLAGIILLEVGYKRKTWHHGVPGGQGHE